MGVAAFTKYVQCSKAQPTQPRGAGEDMRRREARAVPLDPPTFRINRQPISIVSGGLLKPPLLTFIVVNWNYGEFIGQTIDSIRGQDYRILSA
jgi:hypothetical protein